MPRVGNWWFMEESELKKKIKEKFNEYIREKDENARTCGQNLKINNTSLSIEEFLFHKRQKIPTYTINDARKNYSSDVDGVNEIFLNNSTEEIYLY